MTIDKLYELLLSDNPSDNLKRHEKELFELIPELESCKGFNQNSEWHVYDVYEHILHVVDNVSPTLVMRLAALFHDVGKPKTYTEDENGKGHFYGHWEVSQQIFDEFAKRYDIDKSITDRVSNLIYYHDRSIDNLDGDRFREVYDRLGYDGLKELYELKESDLLAQNEKYHYILDDYYNQRERLLIKIKNSSDGNK